MNPFALLPDDALRLIFVQADSGNQALPPIIANEPFTIVSQTLTGNQEFTQRGTLSSIDPGEVYIAQSSQTLSIRHNPDDSGCWAARWAFVHFTLFGTVNFVHMLDLPEKIVGAEAHDIGETIQQLLDLKTSADIQPASAYFRKQELSYQLLRLVCDVAPLKPDGFELLNHLERLTPVFRFIDDTMSESITVGQLAAQANLSRSRFHTFFKSLMDEPPMAYVKRIRLERAQQMLRTSSLAIYEIADAVGFVSQYHFSRAFKEGSGLSPTAYRKQLLADSLELPVV